MGSAVSVQTSSNPYAFGVARGEYERIQARMQQEVKEDIEEYERLPRLDDSQMMVRLQECFDAAAAEHHLDATECRHPVMIARKMRALSEADRKAYMSSVVLAAINQEKANYKPAAVAQDYSKSFSGSAADTKAEKEAAALMKGDGGAADQDEVAEDAEGGADCHPHMRRPHISRAKRTAPANEQLLRKALAAHDRHILADPDVSIPLKFLGPSGCFVYIHSATKEVVSLRPSTYDEDDDVGGGVALANEQIAAEEDGCKRGKSKGL